MLPPHTIWCCQCVLAEAIHAPVIHSKRAFQDLAARSWYCVVWPSVWNDRVGVVQAHLTSPLLIQMNARGSVFCHCIGWGGREGYRSATAFTILAFWTSSSPCSKSRYSESFCGVSMHSNLPLLEGSPTKPSMAATILDVRILMCLFCKKNWE